MRDAIFISRAVKNKAIRMVSVRFSKSHVLLHYSVATLLALGVHRSWHHWKHEKCRCWCIAKKMADSFYQKKWPTITNGQFPPKFSWETPKSHTEFKLDGRNMWKEFDDTKTGRLTDDKLLCDTA